MKRTVLLFVVAIATAISSGKAQSPAPVIVQAVSPAQPAAPRVPVTTAGDPMSALKTLGEIKAANAEVLQKQAATLQQLDELEKSAEQIKIYTKRG